MIYAEIKDRLLTSDVIRSAVASRIYRLQAPQDAPFPFIVLKQVSLVGSEILAGDEGTWVSRYQVDYIDDNAERNLATATAGRALLTGWQTSTKGIRSSLQLEMDNIDQPRQGEGLGANRIIQDYEISFALN